MAIKIFNRWYPDRVVFEHEGETLRGADLSDADLRGANLSGANLTYTKNAETATWPVVGFTPIPEPELAQKILDIVEQNSAALDMSQWHTCNTTHCVWGWATTLNGDGGRVLETLWGVQAAGALLFPSFAPHVTDSDRDAITVLREIAARPLPAQEAVAAPETDDEQPVA